MFNILSQITLKVRFLRNEEQHCLLPSLVEDFTCVHSKTALLTSCQLYLLVPLSSFLAHLLALNHISFQRYSEAQPEQAEAKHRSPWTTLIYVKCRYSTSSHKSSRLERGSFPASCGVHFLTFGFCTPHDQHFHFWFRLFARKIALS